MAKPKPKVFSRSVVDKPMAANASAPRALLVKPAAGKRAGLQLAVANRPSSDSAFALSPAASPDRLERLQDAIRQVRAGRRDSPRTARLLAAGAPKLAQKLVEEAAEVAIEAVRSDRTAVINESVDLLYNLTALLTGLDVDLAEVWAEMDRREATLGMAEKLPKTDEV